MYDVLRAKFSRWSWVPRQNLIVAASICFIFLLILTVCGCGKWPPVVNSARDIRKLGANEPSLRARGLSDEDIPSLQRLPNLKFLDFTGGRAVEKAKISDAGLKALSEITFTRLDTLSLGYCDRITDAGLCHLTKLKTVKWLSLSACSEITDNGLSNLTSMITLDALDIRGCPKITDNGLVFLGQMDNLREILLGGCHNISSNGVLTLQKALPKCRVQKDDREWAYH